MSIAQQTDPTSRESREIDRLRGTQVSICAGFLQQWHK